MKPRNLPRSLVLPLLLLAATACGGQEAPQAPTGTPPPLTETYANTMAGLALDHPAGWRVDAVDDAFVHLFAPAPSTTAAGSTPTS